MKVLHVNAVYGQGSTGRMVRDLDAAARAAGIESSVAYSAGLSPPTGYRIGTGAEKKLHALESRLTGQQAYFSRHGTRGLLRYVEAERPDVVHLHNLHANYVHLPMLLDFLAERDIATVLTLHDCWFFTGKCCHYTADGCMRWQVQCGSCPRLRRDNPSWFRDATTGMLEDKRRLLAAIPRLAVVGVSDWVTGEAEKSLLSSARIIRRIHNWIDLGVFAPDDSPQMKMFPGVGPAPVVLGVASAWSDAKGLSAFGELATSLHAAASRQSTDGAVSRVALVGSIKRGVRVPPHVLMVGSILGEQEMAARYSAAGVFVQLSLEETFGNVTAEALACGTPVIVYDSSANKELVGRGCGEVVRAGDMDGVMRAVMRVLSRPKTAYTRACRDFAELNFGRGARIGDYIALYEELVGLRGGV